MLSESQKESAKGEAETMAQAYFEWIESDLKENGIDVSEKKELIKVCFQRILEHMYYQEAHLENRTEEIESKISSLQSVLIFMEDRIYKRLKNEETPPSGDQGLIDKLDAKIMYLDARLERLENLKPKLPFIGDSSSN